MICLLKIFFKYKQLVELKGIEHYPTAQLESQAKGSHIYVVAFLTILFYYFFLLLLNINYFLKFLLVIIFFFIILKFFNQLDIIQYSFMILFNLYIFKKINFYY